MRAGQPSYNITRKYYSVSKHEPSRVQAHSDKRKKKGRLSTEQVNGECEVVSPHTHIEFAKPPLGASAVTVPPHNQGTSLAPDNNDWARNSSSIARPITQTRLDDEIELTPHDIPPPIDKGTK